MVELTDSPLASGFWERRDSRYPLPISRHLWDLMTPLFQDGTQRAFERYGCALEYFEVVRFKGRRYFRAHLADTPEKLCQRESTAERAWKEKLWRQDCAAWPEVKNSLRRRLIEFARRSPDRMPGPELHESILELRRLFREGTLQHFIQQPASMIPVGDWVRRTRDLTGASVSSIIAVLQNCRSGLADCVHMIDQLVETIRSNASLVAIVRDKQTDPAVRLERLRQASTSVARHLDGYMEEYGDRIVTGFDILDATLRELPACTLALISYRMDLVADKNGNCDAARSAESRLRALIPSTSLREFEEGLVEAKTAYGLHDEDVRTTYLWPLGLMRRRILAAAEQLVSDGALYVADDIFQTTPEELEALMTGKSGPGAEEISRRADEWRAWASEEPPSSFGERPLLPAGSIPGEACMRISSAIFFYLAEMEGRESYPIQPSANVMLQGLAASPGCYEGRARIVRGPADLNRVSVGDVLVAQTTSPAYNVILPSVGAVVTDRGGTLCHAAIIAREFSVPAVVGLDQATLRIPDGARVLVDGDHGFVAIRG
jgi:phosphohistidine swiveling domain-containing protein